MDELVVFLMRSFGWSLEYTVGLVKTLPTRKLNALIKELSYQKAVDDYNLRATIINAAINPHLKHPLKIEDIIGEPPKRIGGKDTLKEAAGKEGIILPSG